ncbi:MAG: selenium metabolism-associated LysR family transcriptional regulator [Thermodesulfobacteriota bacterium]
MDLWQLKIFQKVVELEGFSRAADAIHLTQPTVSSHIKELEAHFGCRLVDRMGKKAVATRAGLLLYEYSQRLLGMAGETETAMAEFMGKISGHLAAGGSTIPGNYILPRLIGNFTQQYPKVRISIHVGDTQQILKDIADSRLDLGVVGAETDKNQLIQKKLIADEMRLIVAADHKWADENQVSLHWLLKEPFIMREPGSGTLKSLQKSIAAHDIGLKDFQVAAEFGSTASVIQGIKHGIGISILSPVAVADELEAGSLKALAIQGVDLTRNFYLTTHRDRTPSPLCRAFMEYLAEKFPENPGPG